MSDKIKNQSKKLYIKLNRCIFIYYFLQKYMFYEIYLMRVINMFTAHINVFFLILFLFANS